MAMDYAVLKTEITTDPNGYGYAEFLATRTDWKVTALVNKVRAAISVPRPDVTPLEILEAIKVTDFISNANALYAAWFQALATYPSVRILNENATDTRVMTNLMTILANGSASENRLRALASRPGSRAEQLFGVGVTIADGDIGKALAS